MFENEDIEFEDDEFDPMVDEANPDIEEMDDTFDDDWSEDNVYDSGERDEEGHEIYDDFSVERRMSTVEDDSPAFDPDWEDDSLHAWEDGLSTSQDYPEDVDYSPDEIIQEAARIKKSGLLRG